MWLGYYHLQQSMLEMPYLSAELFLIDKVREVLLPPPPPLYTKVCLRCLSGLFTYYCSSHSNLWDDLCTGLIVVYDMK